MPKITKILSFTTDDAPEDHVIYILQDSDDWYWIKKLVEVEGFTSPFAYIQDIELHLDMKLTLVEEIDIEREGA